MIPDIIHTVHFGDWPSVSVLHFMASVSDLNKDRFEFLLWNEQSVSGLGLDLEQLKRDFPSWAGVSNVVRLAAVLKYGGIYLDTDFECLKRLDPLLQYNAFAAKQRDGRLCNAVFGATPGHPWVKWQLDRVNESKGLAAFWGVDLMSAAPRDGLTIIPTEWVYPFMWDDEKEKRVAHPDSLLIHHWAGSWV